MICCGAAWMPRSPSRSASACRKRRSPAGSPYCSDNAASCWPAVTLRSAPASKAGSSQSAGSVPKPGIGRPPGGWNMPRISGVALIGSGVRGAACGALACRPRGPGVAAART